MSTADLSIKVSADTASATKQVEKLSAELVDLGKGAQAAAVGVEKINPATSKVQTNLAKMAIATTKADSALDKIKSSSNTAGQSLQNLGRIAQDAPFGFIGIQNNLNPLLESFGRLKTETGSAGGALKALAGSLTGVGGLGLAVSVVTSLLTMASMGMFDSKESAKDLGSEIESLGVDFENAKKSVEDFNKEIDATKALRDLNLKINLPNEKTRLDIELGFDRQDLETKLRELRELEIVSEEKRARAFDLVNKKGSKGLSDLIGQYTSLSEVKKRSFDLNDSDNQLLDAAIKAEEEKTSIIRQQEILRISINKLTAQHKVDLIELNKKEQGRIKDINTIAKELEKLANKIRVLSKEQDLFGIDKSKEKISAITSTIDTLFSEFKLNPKDTIIQKLFGDIQQLKPLMERIFANIKIPTALEIKIDREQAEKEAYDKLGKTPMKTKAQIEASINFSNKETDKSLNDMQNKFLELTDSIAQGLATAISQGSNVLAGVFDGVLHTMGKFLVELGKAAILTSKLFLAIKASGTNPITGIVAGIAAIAAGYILQSIKIPGFANGVNNFGGGMAIVGERGPELVRLPKGSDVIPNGRANGMAAGNGTQVFIPSLVLRGQDMVVAFNRANQTIGRNG